MGAQRAPRSGRAASRARDLDPVREPRSPARHPGVARARGPRAKARDRAPRRLLLRAEPPPEGRARGARRRRRDVSRPRAHGSAPAGQPAARERISSSGARTEACAGTPTPASATARCSSRSRSARAASTSSRAGASGSSRTDPELVLQIRRSGRRVDRPLRVHSRAGSADRRRDEQLVHVHPSALAVRHRADRQRAAPGRRARLAERLERRAVAAPRRRPAGADVSAVEPDEPSATLIADRFGLEAALV